MVARPIKNSIVQEIYKYEQLLVGFPNQRSMHSCGILISEEPITNYSVLEFPPKEFPIVQFDMHTAEDIGLEKFDILSQRGLGTIKDTVNLIKEKKGINVDIEDTRISKDEVKCNEFLSIGKTIGCFYIESPAMRGLLRRLKCDNYKVLVAASSIIPTCFSSLNSIRVKNLRAWLSSINKILLFLIIFGCGGMVMYHTLKIPDQFQIR